MFKKFLLPILLCGVLMLGGCGLPIIDTPIDLPPKNAEQTQSKEAPTPSATMPIWKEMDAKWLGVKFKHPSDWSVEDQSYYAEKVEEGIADAELAANRLVNETVKIKIQDNDATKVEMEMLAEATPFTELTQEEWTIFFENAYANIDTYYYNDEFQDTPINIPWHNVKVLDYSEKKLGQNEVLRISVSVKYVQYMYDNNGREPDPSEMNDPDYRSMYEWFETFWFVNLPEGKGFFLNYETVNKEFPRLNEIEKLIASLTATEPSPFEEYFTYSFSVMNIL